MKTPCPLAPPLTSFRDLLPRTYLLNVLITGKVFYDIEIENLCTSREKYGLDGSGNQGFLREHTGGGRGGGGDERATVLRGGGGFSVSGARDMVPTQTLTIGTEEEIQSEFLCWVRKIKTQE